MVLALMASLLTDCSQAEESTPMPVKLQLDAIRAPQSPAVEDILGMPNCLPCGEKPSIRQLPEDGLVTPAEIAAEVIPQEGAPTSYGVSLSLNNTRRFIDYYNAVTLTPEQQSTMRNALLPLKAPCCDDYSVETCCCPCNAAKSVWGLSNYLIVEKNYDVDQVRESALQWLRFIHSDYYVIQELSNRGIDPGMYGLSHENACYVGKCELPFVDGGCGGMGELKE